MFCPKCGNNCGDNRFCGRCGAQVQEAVQVSTQPAWSVGMACPHCGGTKLEGNHCAFCGAQLMTSVSVATSQPDPLATSQDDSFDIPYGKYGRGGRLTLLDDHFTCAVKGFFKTLTVTVPYHRITRITYVHPRSEANRGTMTIYWDNAADVVIPSGLQPGLNHYQLSVKEKYCEVLYHLCYVLKHLASNAVIINIEELECEPEVMNELDSLSRIIDFDKYFEEFNPYRQQAWEAMSNRTSISPYRTRVLVHRAFDQRQKDLYECDPSLAIRDLNRAIKEKRRQEVLRDQEFAARQAQSRATNRFR